MREQARPGAEPGRLCEGRSVDRVQLCADPARLCAVVSGRGVTVYSDCDSMGQMGCAAGVARNPKARALVVLGS